MTCLCGIEFERKKLAKPYGGWSSGTFPRWCRRLQEETAGTGCLCPEGLLSSETSTTLFLPRGTPVETKEGTWNPKKKTRTTVKSIPIWRRFNRCEKSGFKKKQKNACSHAIEMSTCIFVCVHTCAQLQGNAAKCSDSAAHLPSPHFSVAQQQKAPYRRRDNQPYLIL